MKRNIAKLAGFALVLAIGGLLFAWSGLYNVAATAGHWPVTAWLLHFTMRNSVETHAMPLDAPPLDEPALAERGAGHYETGCAPCHGAPGSPANRIPNKMLPEPPYLPAAVDDWTAEELFWIVKHGLKYTGMPAWPAESRDDEVWAVTAFLTRLPQISAEEYALLAKGAGPGMPASTDGEPKLPETPGEIFRLSDAALIGACVRCHGIDGAGRPSGAFPRLDMQSPDYLARALEEYASGVRPSGIMQPIAAALDGNGIERLARHYAEQAGEAPVRAADAERDLLELGRRIAAEGFPERQIAACSACHGLEDGPENPLFPNLAGQYAAFTILQLTLWKEGKRGGSSYSEIMEPIVADMSADEIEAVALYYQNRPARQGGAAAEPEVAPAP
jgi:cytochrome c553